MGLGVISDGELDEIAGVHDDEECGRGTAQVVRG